ncbi:hypothetical protein P353_09670 [Comamonas testosteroni]|uniref:Uncharacterized protein n=1 Tax=Comamonas testosteroni TaxID=285 RepID=A0A096FLE6_COMTE|nr:hypothetical protein P353_09670 [Comamonas testosteroni]
MNKCWENLVLNEVHDIYGLKVAVLGHCRGMPVLLTKYLL